MMNSWNFCKLWICELWICEFVNCESVNLWIVDWYWPNFEGFNIPYTYVSAIMCMQLQIVPWYTYFDILSKSELGSVVLAYFFLGGNAYRQHLWMPVFCSHRWSQYLNFTKNITFGVLKMSKLSLCVKTLLSSLLRNLLWFCTFSKAHNIYHFLTAISNNIHAVLLHQLHVLGGDHRTLDVAARNKL